jgi:hypothetical protein
VDSGRPAVPLDLVAVDLEHLIEAEERRARPYLRFAALRAFWKSFRRLASRTGETMSTCPSVETSSGVSALILSRSSTGRSTTRARLLPCLASLLIMARTWGLANVTTLYHQRCTS